MKILIIKTSSLGDIVHAFDTLSYLREKCPFSQIDWMVEERCAELVHAHPNVDMVHVVPTKKWLKKFIATRACRRAFFKQLPYYDVVFDLQGNCKSAWLLSQVKARLKIGYGWRSVAEWPNCFVTHRRYNPPKGLNIREDYLYLAQSFFQDKHVYQAPCIMLKINEQEQKFVEQIPCEATLVCPFTAWPNKCLAQQQLLLYLKQEQSPFYVVWGNEAEKEQAQKLVEQLPSAQLLPKVSLPVLQRIMARCHKVVAMDSLALHLCGTTSTPTISFFGPSLAAKYAPRGLQHQALQGSCPYEIQFHKRCPQLRSCQSGACIKDWKSK